ncbi:MAG: hypothetical protein IPG09_18355 [Ignavibacteria bacterium]|nr:hypothetical protein [Ignavibacteria bacterium]
MFNVDPAFINGGVLTYALAVQPVIAGQLPAIYRPSLPVVHQNQLRIKNTNGTSPGAGPNYFKHRRRDICSENEID